MLYLLVAILCATNNTHTHTHTHATPCTYICRHISIEIPKFQYETQWYILTSLNTNRNMWKHPHVLFLKLHPPPHTYTIHRKAEYKINEVERHWAPSNLFWISQPWTYYITLLQKRLDRLGQWDKSNVLQNQSLQRTSLMKHGLYFNTELQYIGSDHPKPLFTHHNIHCYPDMGSIQFQNWNCLFKNNGIHNWQLKFATK